MFRIMNSSMVADDQAAPDFGVKIRQLREERGVSLRQISDVTNISIGVYEALERNDISLLPGGLYRRALVRSYAIEVGLDPEQMVQDFLSQCSHERGIAESPHVAKLRRKPGTSRSARPVWIISVLLAVVAIAVFALFW